MNTATGPSVTVTVTPYASSMPLGCFAFGVGNVLLSALTLHWIKGPEAPEVALILLAFVAPLELIPCVIGFLSRDTGAATAMGLFSAAWVVQGLQMLKSNAPSSATAVFLLLLALCLAILAAASMKTKPLIGGLLLVALLRSVCAAAVQFGFDGFAPAMSWLGLLLAGLAFFSGVGLLFEDTLLRPLAMTFRRGEAKAAMDGSLEHQMARIGNEAGVRQQL